MQIKAIAKADTNLIAVLIEEDGQERVFWICAPAEIRDKFADELAAYIVVQRLEVVNETN